MGEVRADAGIAPGTSLDAFHRGAFHLVQPLGGGHRSGVDAMLLAAAVPDGFTGAVADFGAGAGAAGLAVAARCPQATVTLIERAPEMVECARLTLQHPLNHTVAARASIVAADVTLSGREREAAGLPDRTFDFVIMNPPFNAGPDRATPDRLKRSAHVMEDGLFDAWLRSAAAVIRPGGQMAVIARPASLAALLDACRGRFGSLEIKPVQPRADRAAIRIVLRGRAGARGTLTLAPPLVLHEAGDAFTREADAINNGRTALFAD